MQLCFPLGREGREELDVWEGETVHVPARLWFIWWQRQRCSGPAYNWRLSHWDTQWDFLLQGSVWPRPTILFLRNSFQKRTFLMPTSSWWQEYYMAPPLWSWVPCLISWAQLPAHTRFSLPPLTRGLCSARLAITYLWMPQSQLGGGTPGVPSWLLPGTAQP